MCGSAGFAKAVHAAGWAAEGWDHADDPRADLLDDSLIECLVLRISRKEVAGVHAGLDCKTWSRARKNDGRGPPPLRDDTNVYGLPLLAAADTEKVRIANRMLANVLRLLAAAIEAGVPFSIENPRSSRLWLVPELLDYARSAGAEWAHVDYCQYQVPWRKSTTFLLFNWLPAQPSLLRCTGCQKRCSATGKAHITLKGKDPLCVFWTSRACPYPVALCRDLAKLVVAKAKTL